MIISLAMPRRDPGEADKYVPYCCCVDHMLAYARLDNSTKAQSKAHGYRLSSE